MEVRYGVDGRFVTKTLSDGTACSNDVFGDPAFGVAKSCWIRPGWRRCAQEGARCAFSGTKEVRYGANGTYVTKNVTDGTECSNGVFGDPVLGTAKHCDVRDLAVTTPKDRDPWQWPFAQTSIWNMPIGAQATRIRAGLPGIRNYLGVDEEHFIKAGPTDPRRPVYAGNQWVTAATIHRPTTLNIPAAWAFRFPMTLSSTVRGRATRRTNVRRFFFLTARRWFSLSPSRVAFAPGRSTGGP
jgi:hypothetical protein